MNDDEDVDRRKWAVEQAWRLGGTLDTIMMTAQRFYDFVLAGGKSPGAYTPSAYAAPARDISNISEGHL